MYCIDKFKGFGVKMKKGLSSALKASISSERDAIKLKKLEIDDRFDMAEKIFDVENQIKQKAEKKESVVRDSFTMPKEDYQRIEECKNRSLLLQQAMNKSEILRSGLIALQQLDDSSFLQIITHLKKVKTGRPIPKKAKN